MRQTKPVTKGTVQDQLGAGQRPTPHHSGPAVAILLVSLVAAQQGSGKTDITPLPKGTPVEIVLRGLHLDTGYKYRPGFSTSWCRSREIREPDVRTPMNSGYIRVSVGPREAKVEFMRTVAAGSEVADSYWMETLPNGRGSVRMAAQ